MKLLLKLNQPWWFNLIELIMIIYLIGFVKNDSSKFSNGGGGNIETDVKNKQRTTSNIHKRSTSKCQRITIPMCKDAHVGYNLTEMPNHFNHYSQDDAGMELHQYWPLVEIDCSSDFKLFICSLYVPKCIEGHLGVVPPCRTLCERAKHGCEPIMVKYGFAWPERMKCDRFPTYDKGNHCINERNGEPSPAHRPLQPTTINIPQLVYPKPQPPCKNCTVPCQGGSCLNSGSGYSRIQSSYYIYILVFLLLSLFMFRNVC